MISVFSRQCNRPEQLKACEGFGGVNIEKQLTVERTAFYFRKLGQVDFLHIFRCPIPKGLFDCAAGADGNLASCRPGKRDGREAPRGRKVA
jgi:hypothetical protein